MRDPAFWWTDGGAAAALLAPAAACYGAFAARRMARPGGASPVPVICVGNFTLGGAGKTPAAIALARLLMDGGRRPFFLSRGYGGRIRGPLRLDPGRQNPGWQAPGWQDPGWQDPGWQDPGWQDPGWQDRERDDRGQDGAAAWTARDVGDEPLLLARVAPAIVARNRPMGIAAAAAGGADTIVMDDGLQNPSVAKDLAVAVVDGRRGTGNGRVFPAGPLRAPLAAQFERVDALVVVGGRAKTAAPSVEAARQAARRRGLPVFEGELVPAPDAVAALKGRPVLAFAGIADPGKFFATLEANGIPCRIRRAYGDHHPYAAAEMADLIACAAARGLTLVTTEKDAARLAGAEGAAELARRTAVLPVALVLHDPAGMAALLRRACRARACGAPAPAEP